jgi:glycerophosphoryl diester phosphodiesterase
VSGGRPLVIAHRGACWDAPENTLEAFDLAVAQGADFVEFDVRMAADGRLVICHDTPPDPCPPQIPTLDETLALLNGRIGLAVEVKDGEAAEPTVKALRAHEIDPAGLFLLSFRVVTLEALRSELPGARAVLNLGRKPLATATQFWGASFNNSAARPRELAQAQRLGLATFVYTVNEPERMRELAKLGVRGIFSDRPAVLRETLAALPARAPARSRPGTWH